MCASSESSISNRLDRPTRGACSKAVAYPLLVCLSIARLLLFLRRPNFTPPLASARRFLNSANGISRLVATCSLSRLWKFPVLPFKRHLQHSVVSLLLRGSLQIRPPRYRPLVLRSRLRLQLATPASHVACRSRVIIPITGALGFSSQQKGHQLAHQQTALAVSPHCSACRIRHRWPGNGVVVLSLLELAWSLSYSHSSTDSRFTEYRRLPRCSTVHSPSAVP